MTPLEVWSARYEVDALARGLSPRTLQGRQSSLRGFFAWCAERSITKPAEISLALLERYRRHLYYYRSRSGRPLSIATQQGRLSDIRVFCRYLTRQGVIPFNPAAEFELPRVHRRLPRAILSVAEVEAVCRQCLLHEDIGIRDRAIIETLYATGIRRMELTNLDLYDLDREQGTLMVREGKGRKDRLLPIGERALAWLDRYLEDVRPVLRVGNLDDQALFLNDRGERFRVHQLSDKVRAYLTAAGIDKPGACHLFRHTMATLMLENGADIRFIQAMLGHASLETTTIYTQVSIRALKEVYARTHPAKHIPRSARARETDENEPDADVATETKIFAELDVEAARDRED
jgi:integrase/recombinase XerD